jgi:O-antigen/teichoic acid export membrane protein
VRSDRHKTLVNLFKGGLPALLSSVITALLPAAGILFLSTESYAVWALAATLTTIFLLIDFGTTSLATKLAAEQRLSGSALGTLYVLTTAPPLALTAITAAAWPTYARHAGLIDAQDPRAILLIILVGIGTALRSFGLISAAVALGRRQFGRRGTVLLGGALVQAVVTIGALYAGVDFLALGFGIVTAGILQSVVGVLLAKPDLRVDKSSSVWPLVRRFASARGVAVILGVTVTQLDRWSLGLFAGAAALTAYDLAIRFATMPKIALLAFGSGLITEASGDVERTHLHSLYQRYSRLFAALSALAALPVLVITLVVASARTSEPLSFIAPLAIMAVVAHAVNAMTIPASFLTMGAGRPEVELAYLAPLAVLCGTAYVLGNVTGSPLIQVATWGTAMVITSISFIFWAPRFMKWTNNAG